MKALISLFFILVTILTVHADEIENLKLKCLASDGSTFLMDQFQNDPCRIRQIKNDTVEEIVGLSLCLYPNDVHSSFSFWWFIPNQSRSMLLGELELVRNNYVGKLSYSTSSTYGHVSLDCKVE